MLDDLIEYKEELEAKEKYVPIIDNYTGHTYQYSEKISKFNESDYIIEQIANNNNTDKVFIYCEELFMQCIDLLMKHGIPFNRLVLSANPGFFCKKVAYDNFMNDEEKLKFGEKVKRNLYGNLLTEYIPITFRLDLDKSLIDSNKIPSQKSCSIDEYIRMYRQDISTEDVELFLNANYVKGIINVNEFASRIYQNGYDISYINSYDDFDKDAYLKAYFDAINGGYGMPICIYADFTRKRTK